MGAEILGINLSSSRQLPTPPTGSSPEQISQYLTELVGRLNNNDKNIVISGTYTLTLNNDTLKVAKIPHNLGYTPRAYAYFDHVVVTAGLDVYQDVNIPLPLALSTSIDVNNNVVFGSFLDYFVDSKNFYLRFIAGHLTTGTATVKYQLTRDASN